MQREGLGLGRPLGSFTVYWYLLCVRCRAGALKYRDESAVDPGHLAPRGTEGAGAPRARGSFSGWGRRQGKPP